MSAKVEIYKKNQKKAKIFRKITPLVLWGFVALALVCFVFAIRGSVGNLAEIVNLLDDKKYNGTELAENYSYLLNKYGEWHIGDGSKGFELVFVDVPHAIFSNFAVLSLIFSGVFLVCALILGKWALPALTKHYETENEDLVNLTILNNN